VISDPLLSWRPEFPILEKTNYMISNSLGAMPRGVYRELETFATQWATRGVRAWHDPATECFGQSQTMIGTAANDVLTGGAGGRLQGYCVNPAWGRPFKSFSAVM